MAKGRTTVAVGLMVVLAASSAVVAPGLLRALLPVVSDGGVPTVDAAALVGTLLLTQLVPLGAGLAVRRWRPTLAQRLKPPADRAAVALNALTLGALLVVHFRLLGAIRPAGVAGMLVLVAACAAVGWLLGGPGDDDRKTLAVMTAVRNAGVGLVIVTVSFAGTPAVTAALAYAVLQTVAVALLALAWGRWSSPGARLATGVAA
jgi:BASS family bile acid:Na+ symporter